MLALRGIVLLLALVSCQSKPSNKYNYIRIWSAINDSPPANYTKGTLFSNYADSFPVARCIVSKPNVEKTCTVEISKFNKTDRICPNIKITAGKGRELFLGGFFQVLPFSNDKVILAWYDNTKESATSKSVKRDFKLSIVNFKNCTTANLSFAIDKIAYGFFPALVLYTDKIDVVLNSKSSCGGADRCKLTFNLKGKQIGGINPYQPKVSQYASPVLPSSPDKGFFMSNQDLKSLQVLLVDSAGKGKELLKSNLEANAVAQRVAFSNGHELYGTCWTSELKNKTSKIYCAQFDAAGVQKFNATVKPSKPVRSLSVRNLPEGGLLLLTALVDDSKNAKTLKVTYISKNGSLGKGRMFLGPKSSCFNSTSELEVRIYQKSVDKYCIETACLEASKSVFLKGKCLPLKDLQ